MPNYAPKNRGSEANDSAVSVGASELRTNEIARGATAPDPIDRWGIVPTQMGSGETS